MKSFLTPIVAALAFNSVLAAPVNDDIPLLTGPISVLPLATTSTRGPPRGTGGVVIPTLTPTRRPGGPNGTRPTASRSTGVIRPTHVIGDPSKPVPMPAWLQRLIDAVLAHLPKGGSNGNGDCDKDGDKQPPHRPTTTRGRSTGTGRPTPPGSITFAPPRPTNNSTLPITTRTGGVGPSITRGVTLSTVTTSRGGSRTTTAEDPDETDDN